MIHRAILPPATRRNLLKLVEVQKLLLRVAANHQPAPRANIKQECRTALENAYPNNNDGKAIAEWLLGISGEPVVLRELKAFASHPDVNAKQDFIRNWLTEMDEFGARRPPQRLTPFAGTDPWKRACKEFLRAFYQSKLASTADDDKIPAALTGGDPFGRLDLLSLYIKTNKRLNICPMCDVTDYRDETETQVLTDLDHFFPHSIYPHLSVHPLNLVPICQTCNRRIKYKTDPLEDPQATVPGRRRSPSDLQLPYRGSLRSVSYVSYRPAGGGKMAWLERGTGKVSPQLDAHQTIFQVPVRWAGRRTLDWYLFQQVMAWLDPLVQSPITPGQLVDQLDLLAGALQHYEVGQMGMGLSVAWWAAEQARAIAAQIRSNQPVRSALLEELNARSRQNALTWERLRRTGRRLRIFI